MKELHQKYPEDLDAATLYAAALMNLSPWNYWSEEGHPGKYTQRSSRPWSKLWTRPRHMWEPCTITFTQ